MPRWLVKTIIGVVLAVTAWAAKDRLSIEQRLSSVQAFVTSIDSRLTRIETKLDKVLGDR